MRLRFENDSSKQHLARWGPAKIFGMDVDRREKFNDGEAIVRFDKVWEENLESAVRQASRCDIEFVRTKVAHRAQNFINATAAHREFTLASCLFICQLTDEWTCDQLWFIPSTSGDPRTLYVKFETVPIKEEFDATARRLGWGKPGDLAEKILRDFMESVNRQSYRNTEPDDLDDLWSVT